MEVSRSFVHDHLKHFFFQNCLNSIAIPSRSLYIVQGLALGMMSHGFKVTELYIYFNWDFVLWSELLCQHGGWSRWAGGNLTMLSVLSGSLISA